MRLAFLTTRRQLTISYVRYFTKDEHQGVSVFRRRKTSEQGHRGFRLTALGILLAKSARPRPWRHVSALRALMHSMYRKIDARGVLEPVDADWDLARSFFEARKVQNSDLGGAGDWKGWSEELDGVSPLDRYGAAGLTVV